MAGKTEKEERKTLTAFYHGTPGSSSRQVIHIHGIRIPKRGKITEEDVPRGFPLTLDELAKELKKIPGMEVG